MQSTLAQPGGDGNTTMPGKSSKAPTAEEGTSMPVVAGASKAPMTPGGEGGGAMKTPAPTPVGGGGGGGDGKVKETDAPSVSPAPIAMGDGKMKETEEPKGAAPTEAPKDGPGGNITVSESPVATPVVISTGTNATAPAPTAPAPAPTIMPVASPKGTGTVPATVKPPAESGAAPVAFSLVMVGTMIVSALGL
jgi:hypothetical protein